MSIVAILTITIFLLTLIYSIRTYYRSATFVNGRTPLPSTYKDKLNDNFNGILIFYDEMTNIKLINFLSNKIKKFNSSILINVLDEREPIQTNELIKVYQVKSTPTAFIIENGVVKKSINANEKILSVKELEDFIQS
ncbi:hypothetical protein [Lysinibacillus pakistanensis]|uniref:Thioredoxin domain-containing protein n=1 Tax=Lysinibacillus pakistanensis TaxID=759811 RepID=A0AAX3WWF2_9BACI|nr:hypothetical protein [Lysinibacillus pakistanensis]MDM5230074.1 hypothetical protein [Lysinibacillus pakistanensis]WHY45672.1 hypothetical protein QNH22_20710 [Lysinibacillus pakistanensis]WHY50680.1 hypothetical protein QNH24_20675 [Lysinibacillus pakistanensis]